MADPTYVKAEIEANQTWSIAFMMSELLNDNAPIGWGRYIYAAEQLEKKYKINSKATADG